MSTVADTEDAPPAAIPVAPVPPPFWRAIAIGALLIPLSTYYGNYAYVVVQSMLWGQTSLLRGPVFVLFLLTLFNILLRKGARRAGLQPSEMVLIYSMIAISVCVSGFGQVQFLVNILPAGPYFATSLNHYDRFLFLLPPALTPHDPRVITDFFVGHTTLYRADILRDWAGPVTIWSLFLFGICWVSLCLTSLVRRQWTDGERLTFPLVQLPLEMARAGAGETPFYRSRVMWAGFLLAGLLESVDYLHFFFPALPYIPLKPSDWHLEQHITSAPWNSVGVLTLAFYPFAIGIAFLLSTEVSFSCWFFYLLTRVENVVTAALGAGQGGSVRGATAQAPFLGEQGAGAFLALGLLLLWRARGPIADAFRATRNASFAAQTDDPNAPLSPRAALWGALVGVAVLTAFLAWVGLPVWLALAFWGVYLLFLVVLTRIIAEAGAGWAWGPLVPVHGVLLDITGVGGQSARALTTLGYLDWFDSELRDSAMPHQLEAMKLGQDTRTPRRQLLYGLLIAAALAAVVGFWAHLHMYYEFGAASAKVRPALQGVGPGRLKEISNWLNNPTAPDRGALGGMAVGAVVIVALAALRQTFVWWPLHPIGYALAGTQSMEYMWCPFLIAWAAKTLVVRYGGLRAYRLCLPFFLGLILGDYIVPTLWGLWGMANHTQVYMSFPH